MVVGDAASDGGWRVSLTASLVNGCHQRWWSEAAASNNFWWTPSGIMSVMLSVAEGHCRQ